MPKKGVDVEDEREATAEERAAEGAPGPSPEGVAPEVAQLLALQGAGGNAAVTRLVVQGGLDAAPAPDVEALPTAAVAAVQAPEDAAVNRLKRRAEEGLVPPPARRRRKRDDLSDGESESEDPDVVWRAERPEEQAFRDGLLPPPGHDPTKTAADHVRAGTKAKTKSAWVSASRSMKVAAAWSGTKGTPTGGRRSGPTKKSGRLVKIVVPAAKRAASGPHGRDVYDLTNKDEAALAAITGSALTTAQSSQELLIHGGLPPQSVVAEFEVRDVSVAVYEQLKAQLSASPSGLLFEGKPVYRLVRTRAKTTERPTPRVVLGPIQSREVPAIAPAPAVAVGDVDREIDRQEPIVDGVPEVGAASGGPSGKEERSDDEDVEGELDDE